MKVRESSPGVYLVGGRLEPTDPDTAVVHWYHSDVIRCDTCGSVECPHAQAVRAGLTRAGPPARARKLLVVEEITCPRCRGEGWVQHPSWTEFWRAHSARPTAEEEITRWFREHDLLDDDAPDPRDHRMPAEELICPECGGCGWTERKVPLAEALAAVLEKGENDEN